MMSFYNNFKISSERPESLLSCGAFHYLTMLISCFMCFFLSCRVRFMMPVTLHLSFNLALYTGVHSNALSFHIHSSLDKEPFFKKKYIAICSPSFKYSLSFIPHMNGFSYLLLVLATRRVQRLDESSGMANEDGVAGGSYDHAEHGEPYIRQTLWSLTAITYAEHVTHCLKHGKGVQLTPCVILQRKKERKRLNSIHLQPMQLL